MLKWLYDKLYPRALQKRFSTEETQGEAKSAIERAQTGQNEVRAREQKVNEIVSALRVQREINHFGELIEKTMKGTG